MTNIEKICYFLGITKKTWYNWKDEERLITNYIERYIPIDHIDTFIKNGEVPELDKKTYFNAIALSHYDKYIESVISASVCELKEFIEYGNRGNISKIDNYIYQIPIFIIFEYVLNNYIAEDDDSIGSSILDIILNNYTSLEIKPDIYNLQSIFKIDKDTSNILSYFWEVKDFLFYYKYGSDLALKNKHAFFHSLYNKLKEIIKQNNSNEEKIRLFENQLNEFSLKTNFNKKLFFNEESGTLKE